MRGPTPIRLDSFERARAALASRLAARQAEIEEAVLTRILSVSDANESQDPEYLQGLRAASAVAVRYALAVIEGGEERPPKPPPVLLAQARLAARNGVGLDTVLRRYSAGYMIFSDFLVEEAERGGLRAAELQRLMRSQAVLDQLLAAIGEEYGREGAKRPVTSEERRAELIERLLAGELLDTSGLEYDFEANHIGVIASGPRAQEALRELATTLDRRLLAIDREDGTLWAWLGSSRPMDIEELQRYLAAPDWPPQTTLAIGEPGEGPPSWRLSHQQAKAALPIALRSAEPFTRYVDVALLAAVLKDELLATSLRKLYLEPLEAERDGGEVARETLRAYFASGCNVSSAAVVLGVSRQAANGRLRAIEATLGRPLASCESELETALRLRELDPRVMPAAL